MSTFLIIVGIVVLIILFVVGFYVGSFRTKRQAKVIGKINDWKTEVTDVYKQTKGKVKNIEEKFKK